MLEGIGSRIRGHYYLFLEGMGLVRKLLVVRFFDNSIVVCWFYNFELLTTM